MNRITRSVWFACGLVLLPLAWAFPQDASAAVLRHAKNFVLPGTETVHDDLYAAGRAVDIQGTVDGDLIVAGQTVTIGGIVTGDVIAAARDVTISGSVGGSVRAMGSVITIDGTVGHDIVVGSGNLVTGPHANIGRDVLAAVGSASLGGRISRDVRVGTGSATFSGSVGGNVHAHAKEISLTDSAVLEGDLLYTSRNPLVKAQGATVKGRVEQRVPRVTETRRGPGHVLLHWLRGIFGMGLLGLIFFLLFTGVGERSIETLGRSPWPSLGLGVLLAVAVPVAAMCVFILGIFFGGWWIGLGVIVLHLFALACGYVVSATAVGKWILARIGRAGPGFALGLAIGLLSLGIVGFIPFIGMLAGSTAALFGVGAIAMAWFHARRGNRVAPPSPAARPAAAT